MLADAVEELAAVAADGLPPAVVGRPEAAADHAADVVGRVDEEHRLAFSGHGHRGDHAGGGGTVNDHVGAVPFRGRRCNGRECPQNDRRERPDFFHAGILSTPEPVR